ncbi:MAG: ABC transporter permease [Propionibacteriaceae bacterium]
MIFQYLGKLIAEAWRITKAALLPSLGLTILAASVVATTLMTTGQTASLERSVMNSLNTPEARVITVLDQNGMAHLRAESLARIAGLPDVKEVFGISRTFDLQQGTSRFDKFGPRIALISVLHPPSELIVSGGWTGKDGIYIGAKAQKDLEWRDPSGTLLDDSGNEYPIVGSAKAKPPFTSLEASTITIVKDPSPDIEISRITILCTSIDAVPQIIKLLPNAISSETKNYSIESSSELQKATELASSSIVPASRHIVVALLAALLLVEAIALALGVRMRRQSFARQRAMGATRSGISILVLTQAIITATIGSLLGGIISIAALQHFMHVIPPWSFTLGTILLTIVVSAIASLAPAFLAARTDPAQVLRVP